MIINTNVMDDVRVAAGLLTIDEVLALCSSNTIFDPFSVLISRKVEIGAGNILYPVTSLLSDGSAKLTIGNDNTFHSGTVISATSGDIVVANKNQFGEGGFTAKANRVGARILIGSRGRYLGGATVFGTSVLEDGSQILGAITLDDCHLEGGGSFLSGDPDERGGVLKGLGTARNLFIPRGHVIAAQGQFDVAAIKLQSYYHSRTK